MIPSWSSYKFCMLKEMVNANGHSFMLISGKQEIFLSGLSRGCRLLGVLLKSFSAKTFLSPLYFAAAESCWNGRFTYKNCFLSLELHQEARYKAQTLPYPILSHPVLSYSIFRFLKGSVGRMQSTKNLLQLLTSL